MAVTSTQGASLSHGSGARRGSRRVSGSKSGRRPRHQWEPEEEEALREGVRVYGTGAWKRILQDDRFSRRLSRRKNVDLKDKWRVIQGRSGGAGGVEGRTVAGGGGAEGQSAPNARGKVKGSGEKKRVRSTAKAGSDAGDRSTGKKKIQTLRCEDGLSGGVAIDGWTDCQGGGTGDSGPGDVNYEETSDVVGQQQRWREPVMPPTVWEWEKDLTRKRATVLGNLRCLIRRAEYSKHIPVCVTEIWVRGESLLPLREGKTGDLVIVYRRGGEWDSRFSEFTGLLRAINEYKQVRCCALLAEAAARAPAQTGPFTVTSEMLAAMHSVFRKPVDAMDEGMREGVEGEVEFNEEAATEYREWVERVDWASCEAITDAVDLQKKETEESIAADLLIRELKTLRITDSFWRGEGKVSKMNKFRKCDRAPILLWARDERDESGESSANKAEEVLCSIFSPRSE